MYRIRIYSNIIRLDIVICQLKLFLFQYRYLFKHVIQSYLPTTITVVISWLSFMIPPHSFPGRSGLLSLLILVNINIMLNIIRQSPLVSGICGLTIWSIICLIMVCVFYRFFLTCADLVKLELSNAYGILKSSS